jgi:glycosyltransferase involved in cell wall biosynthesis
LQSEGYSVVAAAPDGFGRDELQQLGVTTTVVDMQPTGLSPIADAVSWRSYRALFRRVRPLAFLGFTAKPNIYGSLAAQRCGVATINTISGLGRVFVSRSLLTILVERLYRFAFRRAKVVFFENRDDSRLFVRRGIVRPEQVIDLPGAGLDVDHFTPVAQGRRPREFTFLFAARLLWDKGVQQFVDAARKVRGLNPRTRFQILGFIEPPGRAAVPIRRLEEWQSEGIIEYLGSAKDVRPCIAEADCVVLPSFYREGVPRILMEAAAMAKPVITTDTPGCRDAVDAEVTGLLCAARSSHSLAGAMTRMIEMAHNERARMGAAGRIKMETEFRDEIVHRAYLDALGKLGLAKS